MYIFGAQGEAMPIALSPRYAREGHKRGAFDQVPQLPEEGAFYF